MLTKTSFYAKPPISKRYRSVGFIVSFLSLILTTAACQTSSTQSDEQLAQSQTETTLSLSVVSSYLDAGRPDKALHELEGVLSKNPNSVEGLNLMGLTQLALSNPKRAVSYLEKAWKIGQPPAVGVNLSSAYLEVSRFKDAEKIINTVLNRTAKPVYKHKERLFHNYGLVAERTNRQILAEKMFKKATEENPMYYMSHLQLARIYQEKKKMNLALKQLESARFACPTCFEAMNQTVKIHWALGNHEIARRLIQDYKLTEGLSASDRKRSNDLENQISKTAHR